MVRIVGKIQIKVDGDTGQCARVIHNGELVEGVRYIKFEAGSEKSADNNGVLKNRLVLVLDASSADIEVSPELVEVEKKRASPSCLECLSIREHEIATRLANGTTTTEIGVELSISTHTVRNHLKSIYRKMRVKSQVELITKILSES